MLSTADMARLHGTAAYCAIACGMHSCGYSVDSLASLSCMHAILMCIVDLSNLQQYYLQSWICNGLFSALAPRVLHYSASLTMVVTVAVHGDTAL